MENPLNRQSKINKNFNTNNESKPFLNFTSSKCDLKSSNLVINQSPIKKMPRLETEIDQIDDDVSILNTTNDKITDESEDRFDLSKEKIEGSLICRNRIIEPIVSLKNENVNESGKYGKLSYYLLNNSKNQSKTKIENESKFNEFVRNKNNLFNSNNNIRDNENFYKLNAKDLNNNSNNNKLAQSFNDSRTKNTIIRKTDEYYYANNKNRANNIGVNFDKNLISKSNYNSTNNFEHKIKNEKENKKLINIPKTGINFATSDPIKKLNNTRISEYEENDYTFRKKDLEHELINYNNNQNNNNNKNFLQQNNNNFINIVNEINTNKINFISSDEPIRRNSKNEDFNILIKKESRKIFCNGKLEFSKPLSQIGDRKVKTPQAPLPKDKNLKCVSSKSNLIVKVPLKNIDFNSSKNSSLSKKTPLYTSEGLFNFVNKAKMTVGRNESEKKLEGLFSNSNNKNEAFVDFNSNENVLDCSRNYGEPKEKFYLMGNSSNKHYNSEKINYFKEKEIPCAFKLAESENFYNANYLSNFNNSCTVSDKLGFIRINKDLNKNSFPNSTNILNHLVKKEDLNMQRNCLSKVTIDLEKLNSTFANDIEYIIAHQRKNISTNNNQNKSNLNDIVEAKDRKISNFINNHETKSHTHSLNSEGIISGKNTVTDKADDLVLCCASNKIDYLKTNLKSSIDDNNNHEINEMKVLKKDDFVIENTFIDILSNYNFKANVNKIIEIQSFFRGFLLRKLFKKCFRNYESLTKVMNLFEKLSKIKDIQKKKKLFNKLKTICENKKLLAGSQIINTINNFFYNKLKSFKDYCLRKIYLFSFTQKISNDLEKKQNRELNKTLEKQKSQFLLLQKEKENHERDLKFSVMSTNFINKKNFNIKSTFLKQLKQINSEIKLLEQIKNFFLKKVISLFGRKSSFKNSSEYLSNYQKALFVHWRIFAEKTGFLNKMKKFMLERILNKKNKITNDQKVLQNLIDKRSNGLKFKIERENIYYNLIKDSYNKVFIYFNKIYIAQIDSENKSNKLMFILQKLIYNKQNSEIKVLKKYLITFKTVIEAKRNEILNERKHVLSKLLMLFSMNSYKAIESKISLWRNTAGKMTKKNNMLLNILLVKIGKNYISTRTYFKSYRYKAKLITTQTKKLNSFFNVISTFNERIKSDIYQLLIKKLRSKAKWNSGSEDMKILNINCSMTRETLENNLYMIDNESNLLSDSSIQDFLIEKNFRFKFINYFWKLSEKERLVLRYYFLRLFNRTNLNVIKQLKNNSFKWSSNTFYGENKRNYSSKKYIEKEDDILYKPLEEKTTNDSFAFEKARYCVDTSSNNKSTIEGSLNQSYSKISNIKPIRRQESEINSELIIQKYKKDLLKTLGIQTLNTENISFELENKIPKGFKKDKLSVSTQNLETFNIEVNSNLEDKIFKIQKAFETLFKLLNIKKQQVFFGLLRCLKIKTLKNSAKLIIKNLKNFYKKSKKSNQLMLEELELNEESRDNLVQSKNIILNPQECINLTIEDFSSYNNQKASENIRAYDKNKENESTDNDLDNSGYSETVIDLVRVIQLYIYDKSNPINNFNHLLRIFNRWRNISNRSKSGIDNNLRATPIQKRLESLSDISSIISESTPKIKIFKKTNNLIPIQDIYDDDSESLMVCSTANQPVKKRNSINMYANHMNNLSNKIEKSISIIRAYCLKGFLKQIQNKQKIKIASFAVEDVKYNYINEENNNNFDENDLRNSIERLTDSKRKSKPKTHKKQCSTDKCLTKLEVFSFDLNLSANINYNYQQITLINPSYILTEDKNLNNSLNIQINKSTGNFDGTKLYRRNTTFNNDNNQSFSQNPYINTGINHSFVYSKNLTFNSELRSDEELDEINEVRISCAIEIQNFWREFKIQMYLINYANKLKFLDKILKQKNHKQKSYVFICYAQLKKKSFMIKMNKSIKVIQKFYRERILKRKKIVR